MLVLFYVDSDYQIAVKEFLESYYAGRRRKNVDPFQQRVHGRCGYIRQAFPVIIESYDVSKISLFVDSPNSKLSDLDFYDAVRQTIKSTQSLSYELHPSYYRRNSYIT